MRLSATAVRVRHDGDPGSADTVTVAYVQDGRLRAVRAKAVVMATGSWINRYVVRDLPEALNGGGSDEWLRARQLKIVVDGGILAGTAYMREPYGLDARALYGVDDPAYRGFLTLTPEQIASAIDIGPWLSRPLRVVPSR